MRDLGGVSEVQAKLRLCEERWQRVKDSCQKLQTERPGVLRRTRDLAGNVVPVEELLATMESTMTSVFQPVLAYQPFINEGGSID
jgi:hypothetical protein